MPRIELDDLGLCFKLRERSRMSLKEFVLRRAFRQSVNPLMEVRALEGVSLAMESGGRLGVIGHNGAGKSTLLKTLAGVYPPTSGSRRVEGRISSLFEIGLGFEPDASGWENIRFRGYLQGETPTTIRDKIDEIAEFSELGQFLDMPVRFYSSGMLVRLAFAVATAIDPEVLLVDEVLAAGDAAFQTKARNRMEELISRAQLMVMVSHNTGAIAELCDRVLWLERGRMRMLGPAEEVVTAYDTHMSGAAAAA